MRIKIQKGAGLLAAGIMLFLMWGNANAMIIGDTGTVFQFTALPGQISTGDGNSVHIWGFAHPGDTEAQYPGPTIIVNEGETITITLTNTLSEAVSIVLPGQENVQASGGTQGLLTREAPPGDTVSYTFVAAHPGTYMYHSGSHPELQIEMGLFGALIVRPMGFIGSHHGDTASQRAYHSADSRYDYEYLFVESEMDHRFHVLVELGLQNDIDNSDYYPVYWFLNGRNAPDTMRPDNYELLPNQPYGCMPMMHPGDRILMRIVNAGRDLHPFHTHGNNFTIIARDGRLLSTMPHMAADLAQSDFTITVAPGGTADAIFTWTGENIGWDIYGHAPEDEMEPDEYEPDHGKPFPVILPETQNLTIGREYSGSPFLGDMGYLPPGTATNNKNAGYFFMWHSHNEKEMVNNDIFPGGFMTMLIIEPHGTMIH